MQRILFSILILMVLTACQTSAETSAPTETSSPTEKTATPTDVKVVLANATPTPTATVAKSTATPIKATGTPTAKPSATATATRTPTAKPLPVGIVNGDLVNVRSAPSTAAEIVGSVKISDTVKIAAQTSAGDWWHISDPLDGWVFAEFVDTDHSDSAIPVETPAATPTAIPALTADSTITQSIIGTITGDPLNVRAEPSTDAALIGTAPLSQTVQLVGQSADGQWLEACCLAGGGTGWLFAEFVAADTTALPTTGDAPITPSPTPPPADGLAQLAPNEDNSLPGDGGFSRPSSNTDVLTNLSREINTLLRPVIVCINNDPQARPQFGIGSADVMYEYLMEGYSITRFSGIFFGTPPAQIGPIRSARLVNYYLGAQYNSPLMCSGASDDVRYLLKNFAPFAYLDIDLDDPSNRLYTANVGNDYRTRLRTGNAGLSNWLSNWEIQIPEGLRGFTFGDLASDGTPATQISIDYPAVTGSNVDYTFDPAGGKYLRFLGDEPHLDGNTGVQVGVENVVVMAVPHEETDMVEDSLGNTGIRLNLFGTGEAIVFRDGKAFRGTWRSDSRGDTPHFFTTSGAEIRLKPGHTWISIVPSLDDVTFGE